MALENPWLRVLKGTGIVTLSGIVYFGSMSACNYITTRNSPKIDSNSELDVLIEQEKKAIGCNRDISGSLITKGSTGAVRFEDGSYFIGILAYDARIADLQHEMGHICNGHLDRHYSTIKFYLLDEPGAIMHQFGRWMSDLK